MKTAHLWRVDLVADVGYRRRVKRYFVTNDREGEFLLQLMRTYVFDLEKGSTAEAEPMGIEYLGEVYVDDFEGPRRDR